MRYNTSMKNEETKNIESIYYIKVFLKDENENIVSCFLGVDTSDNKFVNSVIGKLRLHILYDGLQDQQTKEEKKIYFFFNAVFFKDKKIAEEILDRYIKKISINLASSPPVVEEVARYKDIPLQIMERIGISNGFIKETVHVGEHSVGYRLIIK